MALILFGIALICLFPVWPLSFKRFIFYISVVLLFFLVKKLKKKYNSFIFIYLFLDWNYCGKSVRFYLLQSIWV